MPGRCAHPLTVSASTFATISSLGDQPAPGQELAGDPLDAAAGRLQRGEQRDLHLRLGADHFDVADVVAPPGACSPA